jgi:hypothetical protein
MSIKKEDTDYKKLGDDDYKKPPQTFTDRLTPKDIEELLIDYHKKPINKIVKGSHVRYFVKIDDELKFRLGGIIINTDGMPEYVILSNGKRTWSVQTKNTIFYVRLDYKTIKEEYEIKLFKKQTEIDELKGFNKSLMQTIQKLEKKLGNS